MNGTCHEKKLNDIRWPSADRLLTVDFYGCVYGYGCFCNNIRVYTMTGHPYVHGFKFNCLL